MMMIFKPFMVFMGDDWENFFSLYDDIAISMWLVVQRDDEIGQ
jgi:hypothetical protein